MTHKSTAAYSEQTERRKQAFDEADAVMIGAGAGLSTSAGFTYSGERFERYLADFSAQYGFHDKDMGVAAPVRL